MTVETRIANFIRDYAPKDEESKGNFVARLRYLLTFMRTGRKTDKFTRAGPRNVERAK